MAMDKFINELRNPLFAFGVVFQAVFMVRFIVQWVASERQGKSVVPLAFWYLSLIGSAGLLTYSIMKVDAVFIIGQSVGSVIYVRNLVLIYRERRGDNNTMATPGKA